MIKEIMYEYLGTNGTICSPVHLEDIYYIRKIKLFAEDGKILTNGVRTEKVILIPEDELDQWTEIESE